MHFFPEANCRQKTANSLTNNISLQNAPWSYSLEHTHNSLTNNTSISPATPSSGRRHRGSVNLVPRPHATALCPRRALNWSILHGVLQSLSPCCDILYSTRAFALYLCRGKIMQDAGIYFMNSYVIRKSDCSLQAYIIAGTLVLVITSTLEYRWRLKGWYVAAFTVHLGNAKTTNIKHFRRIMKSK